MRETEKDAGEERVQFPGGGHRHGTRVREEEGDAGSRVWRPRGSEKEGEGGRCRQRIKTRLNLTVHEIQRLG